MVDSIIFNDHFSLMKIKIGELKTHLSKRIKEVNASQEPLEVCVREETVAYLVPVSHHTHGQMDNDIEKKLNLRGLTLTQSGKKSDIRPLPVPRKDQKFAWNSVVEIRKEKDW